MITYSIEKPSKSGVKYLESLLTPENKLMVRRHIYNCSEDDLYAILLLSPFDDYAGHPLSNAFYLHELTELKLFKKEGYNFINVNSTSDFRKEWRALYDKNRTPHLQATKLHCRYLQLKAQEMGHDLSLGTVIEYDPSSSRKNDLLPTRASPGVSCHGLKIL